jgi:hypothetical protein
MFVFVQKINKNVGVSVKDPDEKSLNKINDPLFFCRVSVKDPAENRHK